MAFAAGWFQADVDFGLEQSTGQPIIRTSNNGTRDGYLAKVSRETQRTVWVRTFSGSNTIEGRCVSAGPKCAGGNSSSSGEESCPLTLDFVAAGGVFRGQVTFEGAAQPATSNGGEDAFIVLYGSGTNVNGVDDGGNYITHLTFGSSGSSGHDGVTGIVVDLADQSVIVTGYFTGTCNFNPAGTSLTRVSAGGTDAFVAKYKVGLGQSLLLEWVYTVGTTGHDSGTAAAVDSGGDGYATGFLRGADGSRDVWVVRVAPPPSPPAPPYAISAPEWEHVLPGVGGASDDLGKGIAIDGIDRVLVAGQFGLVREAGGPPTGTITIDFNPGSGTSNLTTTGGTDAFVARYLPDGAYDWAFIRGSDFNDAGAAIAVDPVRSRRVSHAGWFGAPDAAAGYTVDFDPGAGVANLLSLGRSDGFVSSFAPTPPVSVKNQVSIAFDNSGSMTLNNDYTPFISSLAELIRSDNDPWVVPQDETVAINVVLYGSSREPPQGARQFMPWTVFNGSTAHLFADRLERLRKPQGNNNSIVEGLLVARQSLEDSGIDACYRSIGVVAQEPNGTWNINTQGYNDLTLQTNGRDAVMALGGVDQLNGFGVRHATAFLVDRQYAMTNLATAGISGLGFGLQTPAVPFRGFEDPAFHDRLRRMIERQTTCPGDYNRDGFVDQIVDRAMFLADHTNSQPYADWDFDGLFTNADITMFDLSLTADCPDCTP